MDSWQNLNMVCRLVSGIYWCYFLSFDHFNVIVQHLTFGEAELRVYRNSSYYFCNSFVSLK